MTESDQGSARRGVTAGAQRSGGAATVARASANGRPADQRTRGQAAPERARGAAARDQKREARRGEAAPVKKAARKPRRARLRLTQVDAWSVMKTSFLLSIAMGIVSVVAVGIIWSVLGAAGVWSSVNDTVQTVMGNDFQVQDYVGTGRVLGFTMLVSVVNVVLLTAIATLGAFLYNLAATLLGGLELTLTEDG